MFLPLAEVALSKTDDVPGKSSVLSCHMLRLQNMYILCLVAEKIHLRIKTKNIEVSVNVRLLSLMQQIAALL